MKKKLVGGHKKLFFILFFLLLFNKSISASQILDYETESFISFLISEIKTANGIKKNINFKIISDDNINAFVNQNNTIHITSGLIEHSIDYVALLTVLAHEIGHIDNNHISSRISKMDKISSYRNISNLSVIAGSLISGNPEFLQSLALSSASMSEMFIDFSKDQETEADFYSIETIKKLNIYSESIILLLDTIEKKALERGINKSKQKVSTHPYFEDRIKLINYLSKNQDYFFDVNVNQEFQFIRSKFLGYSENIKIIKTLDEPYKNYAFSIVDAKNGDLKKSLKKINKLISLYPNNHFLIETKADILFSYGFTNDSIKFYELTFKKQPKNTYAQIRIFTNTNTHNLSNKEIAILFKENINLLSKFYNNKNILFKYLDLSNQIKKKDWYDFINFLIHNQSIKEMDKKNYLTSFETKDKDLSKLIDIIYNNY